MEIGPVAQKAFEEHVEKWSKRNGKSLEETINWLREPFPGADEVNAPNYPPPSNHPGWVPTETAGLVHWSFLASSLTYAEKSLEELKKKGRDERKRRFLSKIITELRCKPKGHTLGLVYPTKFGYLLVSSTRGPKLHTTPASLSRKEMEIFFKENGIEANVKTNRDRWYIEAATDDEGKEYEEIFDTSLIDWPRDPGLLVASYLHCRCGLRIAPPPWELTGVARSAEQEGRRARIFC